MESEYVLVDKGKILLAIDEWKLVDRDGYSCQGVTMSNGKVSLFIRTKNQEYMTDVQLIKFVHEYINRDGVDYIYYDVFMDTLLEEEEMKINGKVYSCNFVRGVCDGT